MAPPPPRLMEELEEEVLLRFPPHEPALLVRAALVCRRWRRLVSSPTFRRRFRELHRTPPMLGFVCNDAEDSKTDKFVTSTRFCSPDANLGCYRAIDARHGRVLLQRRRRRPVGTGRSSDLVVWDPITDQRRELPFPSRFTSMRIIVWTAAVLCAAGGDCDHLDCHRGPYLVVFLGSRSSMDASICTYSSDAGTWSDLITMVQTFGYANPIPVSSLFVGNALYFRLLAPKALLKYDLESHKMSMIGLPSPSYLWGQWRHVSVDDELGLAFVRGAKLCLLRKAGPEGREDAGWTQSRVIKLETLLPRNAILDSPSVVSFADDSGLIFLKAGLALYRVDLKTSKATEVCMGRNLYSVVPYLSFYTPALGAACADEE